MSFKASTHSGASSHQQQSPLSVKNISFIFLPEFVAAS